ncbi:MAG: ABC transporter permease [Acidobacteriota bacterium]
MPSDLVDVVPRTLRGLIRQPLSSGLAILASAIGIALVTLVFSILHGIFLRHPPGVDLEDVYRVHWRNSAAGVESMPVVPSELDTWRDHATLFDDLAAFVGVSATLTEGDHAERTNAARITPNFFRMVGAAPSLGRDFEPEDALPGAPGVVLLSEELWRQRFEGSGDVLGRQIRVDGESRTIVGVMPAGFRFPLNQYLWMPLAPRPDSRVVWYLQVLGKLAPGADPRGAQAQLAGFDLPAVDTLPEARRGAEPELERFLAAYTDPELRSYLQAMLAASLIVLLIAAINVAALLVARASIRSREYALRGALGGRGLQILAIPLSEALLMTLVAGGLGVLGAHYACRWAQALIGPRLMSYWIEIAIHPAVLAASLAASLVLAVGAGSFPALRAFRLSSSGLGAGRGSSGSPRTSRLHRNLVVLQIGLTVGMLLPAGMVVRGLAELDSLDLPIRTEGVLTAQLSLPASYSATDIEGFLMDLEDRAETIPGVAGVAFGTQLPGTRLRSAGVVVEGAKASAARPRTCLWTAATPGFLGVFGLEPLFGRDVSRADQREGTSTALVTESFAASFFDDPESAVGHRIQYQGSEAWIRIVGVVPDGLLKPGLPERARGRLSIIQQGSTDGAVGVILPSVRARWVRLVLSTDLPGPPAAVVPALRRELARVDPGVPLFWARSMDEEIGNLVWDYRLFGGLFVVFGGLALLQTLLGLFAVIQLGVTRRLREIGVRMALGAAPGAIRGQVLGRCAALLLGGLGVGAWIAWGLAEGLRSLIYGDMAWNWGLVGGVVGVLATTGLLAAWLPARRASSVDPSSVLREG